MATIFGSEGLGDVVGTVLGSSCRWRDMGDSPKMSEFWAAAAEESAVPAGRDRGMDDRGIG